MKTNCSFGFIATLVSLAFFTSCSKDEVSVPSPIEGSAEKVQVTLIQPDVLSSAPEIVSVGAYLEGSLSSVSTSSSSTVELALMPDVRYNIYALVNMPSAEFPKSESELKEFSWGISDMGSLNDQYLPMSGSVEWFSHTAGDSKPAPINVRPLYAKLDFTIDRSYLGGGMTINAVKARNINTILRPFGNSIAKEESLVDYEIKFTNDKATLYIPENVTKDGNLSTYLEVECSQDGTLTHYYRQLGLESGQNVGVSKGSEYSVAFRPVENCDRVEGWQRAESSSDESIFSFYDEQGKQITSLSTSILDGAPATGSFYIGSSKGGEEWKVGSSKNIKIEEVGTTVVNGKEAKRYDYRIDKAGTYIVNAMTADRRNVSTLTMDVISDPRNIFIQYNGGYKLLWGAAEVEFFVHYYDGTEYRTDGWNISPEQTDDITITPLGEVIENGEKWMKYSAILYKRGGPAKKTFIITATTTDNAAYGYPISDSTKIEIEFPQGN